MNKHKSLFCVKINEILVLNKCLSLANMTLNSSNEVHLKSKPFQETVSFLYLPVLPVLPALQHAEG